MFELDTEIAALVSQIISLGPTNYFSTLIVDQFASQALLPDPFGLRKQLLEANKNDTNKPVEELCDSIDALVAKSALLERDTLETREIEEYTLLIAALFSGTPIDSLLKCDLAIIKTGCPNYKYAIDAIVGSTQKYFSLNNVFPDINIEKLVVSGVATIRTTASSDTSITLLYESTFTQSNESLLEFRDEDYFQEHCLYTQQACILKNYINYPAMERWLDFNYFTRLVGTHRSVPVEFGKSFESQEFDMRYMRFHEFVSDYITQTTSGEYVKGVVSGGSEDDNWRDIGYMAQHDLTMQSKALMDDFWIPDQCYGMCGDSGEAGVAIRFWIGPGGTCSPRHSDPKDNLFVGVVGYKRFLIYGKEVSDTREVLVGPGDMLFIPKLVEHSVGSLSVCISLSFWF